MPIFHLGMKLFNKKGLDSPWEVNEGYVHFPGSCAGLQQATLFMKENQLGCNNDNALANTNKEQSSSCEHADNKGVLDLAIIYLSFNALVQRALEILKHKALNNPFSILVGNMDLSLWTNHELNLREISCKAQHLWVFRDFHYFSHYFSLCYFSLLTGGRFPETIIRHNGTWKAV